MTSLIAQFGIWVLGGFLAWIWLYVAARLVSRAVLRTLSEEQ